VSSEGLTIRDVARRTGVESATLRMWEQRHGFPEPERLPSGHRRYSNLDVELIGQVVRDRESGLSLTPCAASAR
jgi:DNA-binding transcriptional MerR regulator